MHTACTLRVSDSVSSALSAAPLRHAHLHAEEAAGRIGRRPRVREVRLALNRIHALMLRPALIEVGIPADYGHSILH